MNWRVSIGRSNFVFRFTRSNEKSDPFKRLFLSPTRERERERERKREPGGLPFYLADKVRNRR